MAEKKLKKSEQERFSFFTLSNENQLSLGFSGPAENACSPPPPCAEVPFSDSEVLSPTNVTLESINLNGDLTLYKGRVSTSDVFGVSNSDLVAGKYEGGLKLWEGSLDLVKTLHSEVHDEKLSFTGKRVIELGCGHGLPGIFACLKGASVVHFQDFNAEVLRCLTIPNVKSNLMKNPRQKSLPVEIEKLPEIRFFAGDWSEIHSLLPHKSDDEFQQRPDLMSKQDCCDGYDIILMSETVYSPSSLCKLYELMKKIIRPLGGVYLAAKKLYFGVGGGTRQFQRIVEEDGIMESNLIAEFADGSSNVREVWKFELKP